MLRSFGNGGGCCCAAAAAGARCLLLPLPPPLPTAKRSKRSSSGSGGGGGGGQLLFSRALSPRGSARACRVTTRAMWVDNGRLLERLVVSAERAVARLPPDATLLGVERAVAASLRREARAHNGKVPEVVVVAHEFDPRAAAAVARSRGPDSGDGYDERQDREESRGGRGGRGGEEAGEEGGGAAGAGARQQLHEELGRRRRRRREGRGGRRGGGGTSSSPSSSPFSAAAAAPSAVPVPEGVLRKRRRSQPPRGSRGRGREGHRHQLRLKVFFVPPPPKKNFSAQLFSFHSNFGVCKRIFSPS